MATIVPMLIGIDVFDCEHIWQKLWYAQRFFYTGCGMVDTIDTMLWDLFSRHARLPIYKLLGACRESIPAYGNIGGTTTDEYITDALRVKELGYVGAKDHSYRGFKGNISLSKNCALRQVMISFSCTSPSSVTTMTRRLQWGWRCKNTIINGWKSRCKISTSSVSSG